MLFRNLIDFIRDLFVRWPAVLVGLLLVAPSPLCAQTFDATALAQPADLGMHWLIKAGDDPAYAKSDFDDSQWTNYDPHQTIKAIFPMRPEVIWYRLHVKVSPNQAGLALQEYSLASAFEIYVNGQKFLQTGQVAPFVPTTYEARVVKRVPDAEVATGTLVIALRVHISQVDWTNSYPGFYPYNLTLGEESALSDQRWLKVVGGSALYWFDELVGFGFGIVSLALFTAGRNQREYLWVFLQTLTGVLGLPLNIYRQFHNVSSAWGYLTGALQIAGLIFLVLIFVAFLRIRLEMRVKVVLGIYVVVNLISIVQAANGVQASWVSFLAALPGAFILAGFLPEMLIKQLWRGNREAGILLVPVILNALGIYAQLVVYIMSQIPSLAAKELLVAKFFFQHTLGGITLDVGTISGVLYILSLAIIIVLRATRMSRQQAMLESEMAAAREVQQVILPDSIEQVPGFTIESAYLPAQQVGGDFFQILPAPEESLLLVIGDVAGKGLPAAMLVSVLVGATRSLAKYTSDPAELLANLNQQLVGRANSGFSTALAARIFADGTAEIANAGHLAPYLDGSEVDVPGALPLGVRPGTHYETIRLQLPRGSRLTFYSDGIVEAQNAQRELFGFERGRALSMEPVKAIVEAARKFGQEDDMTAIAITRDGLAAHEPALAQHAAVSKPAIAN